jgi:hypothetical protein
MMNQTLRERVEEHCKVRGIGLTEFYNKAIINQLETEGDFEIRTLVEKEKGEED